MRAGMLAFAAGAILLYWFDDLPAVDLLWVLSGLSGLLLTLTFRQERARRPAWALFGLLLGLAYVATHVDARLSQTLPSHLETRPVTVEGYPCSVPKRGSWQSVQFDWCVTRWPEHPALPQEVKLRLRWYGQETRFTVPSPGQLEVKLKRRHGSVNPAGFQYETWLFREGYLATGTVQSALEIANAGCTGWCAFHRWRIERVKALQAQWGGRPNNALAEALLMGSRGGLKPDHWDVLKATGTAHLVAISGLHIGLIALLAGWLAHRSALLLLGERYGPRPVPLLGALASLAMAGAYALMAGLTLPTQRALIMVAVGGAYWLWRREKGVWDAWLLALCLVLMVDPFAPLGAGFWLSFGAVAVLLLSFWGRLRQPGGWRTLVTAQIMVGLLLWPVLSAWRMPVSGMGFIANLVAIPGMGMVVMPCLLPVIVGLGAGVPVPGVLLDLAGGVLAILWETLTFLADTTQNDLWNLFLPDLDVTAGLLFATAVLTAGLPFMRLSAGLLGACGLALASEVLQPAPANASVAHPQVTVFDVGQGLSVLVRSDDKALLYDTGPAYPSGFSAVESFILPSLEAMGVHRLDWLVLSHGDGDHAGAWRTLADSVPVERVVAGEPERLGTGAQVEHCSSTVRLMGEWTMRFWQSSKPGDDANARSCVLALESPHGEVVLLGDAGQAEERQWLSQRKSDEPVELVLVGHHGSRTASSNALVEALSPSFAIYSVGYRSHYGHPHQEVWDRFSAVGARNLSTALSGALHFTLKPSGVAVRSEREGAPFWFTR